MLLQASVHFALGKTNRINLTQSQTNALFCGRSLPSVSVCRERFSLLCSGVSAQQVTLHSILTTTSAAIARLIFLIIALLSLSPYRLIDWWNESCYNIRQWKWAGDDALHWWTDISLTCLLYLLLVLLHICIVFQLYLKSTQKQNNLWLVSLNVSHSHFL